MSGNSGTLNEPPSWQPATDDELNGGGVLLMAFLPPGNGNPNTQARSATASQLAALVKTGTLTNSAITYNAVPISIPNMPTIPGTGGKTFLEGHVGVYDTVTGDSSEWNIALLVLRRPNETSCEVSGDTTPSLFNTGSQGTTSSCAVVLSAGSSGPVVTLQGLPFDSCIFDWTLTFSTSF